jgi:hypothetical protein
MRKIKEDDRLRTYGRIQIKVYKDLVVTYNEFFEAIRKIGYKQLPSETDYKFMSPKGKSVLSIPKKKCESSPCKLYEKMPTPDFFSYCQSLYLRYEIDDFDDLAKMIEQKRGNEVGRMILG